MISSTNIIPLSDIKTNIENNHKQYLCLFHVIIAGLLDEDMDCDEQEIIEMVYLVIDVNEKKICH